jgi:PmbA protein
MHDDVMNVGQAALDLAREHGADAADVVAVSGEGTDVELRDGNIEKLERDEGTAIGLRVFVGKASAMTSGNVMTRDAMRKLAENAVAMARLAPPDAFAGIAPAELLAANRANLDLAAPELPDGGALQAMAKAAEEAALSVKGVSRSGGASASASRRRVALLTSNGFASSYERTGISVSVSAIAGEATGMERDYDYSSAIHTSDLRSPQAVGERAGARAARRLNPRKVASCQVPVVYDRRVASSLLGHLSGAISGAAIARGTSFLKDSMEQRVFAANITIWDDPLRQRGLGSRPYDGEGLAVRRRAMVENGILKSWFLDLRSANQLGLEPTGQAGRGVGGPPGPTSSNLYLEPGVETPDQMIAAIKQGLLVTEMLGSSINMVTGDYSRGASGYWIENGELAYPVSEITIAGNLRDMFLNLVPANDLEFTSSTVAPTCRIDGLTVAGQ